MITPADPTAPARYPAARPGRRPRAWETRPTATAASADPAVIRALGSPARLVVPSMSWARSAPTVTPAASPAPLRTWEATRARSTRRWAGPGSDMPEGEVVVRVAAVSVMSLPGWSGGAKRDARH